MLSSGNYFGDESLFCDIQVKYGIRASDFTILYAIKKSQFIEIISKNPQDYEKYCFIRDKFIFNNSISCLNKYCWGCGKDTHILMDCNFIHYIPDKEKIILVDIFEQK